MTTTNAATRAGIAAILLWSCTIAIARSLSEQVGALNAATAVYLIGGLAGRARLQWLGTPSHTLLRLPRKYLFGCGGLFIFYTLMLYSAVGLAHDREQALEVGLVNYLWPATTILLSVPLLGKRAGPFLLPGTMVAWAGVAFVMTQGSPVSWASLVDHVRGNPVAYAAALAGAISWALYSNLTRRWSPDGGAVEWFVLATGVILLAAGSFSTRHAVWTARAMIEAGFLGTITAVAYGLWDLAMRRGNLTFVAACSYLTPLLSTLISCAYLQVVPSARLGLGSVLIVVGSIASWRSISESRSGSPSGPPRPLDTESQR